MAAAASEPIVTVSSQVRILAVLVAVLFLFLIIDLIRRRKLQERYTVVWFVAGLGLLALALVPGLLEWLAARAGVRDTNSALFATALLVSGLMLLNLTVVISRQGEQITRLSQEIAILRSEDEAEPDEGNGSTHERERYGNRDPGSPPGGA
jgi:hypothetical protein